MGGATAESLEREKLALELHLKGESFTAIGHTLGYANESGARHAVNRAMRRVVEPDVEFLRFSEDQKHRERERVIHGLLERKHFVVNHGKLIWAPSGKDQEATPLEDDEFVVRCMTELRMISEARCRLWGLNAPMRLVVEEVDEGVVQAAMRHINEQNAKLEAQLRALGEDPDEGWDETIEAEVVPDPAPLGRGE